MGDLWEHRLSTEDEKNLTKAFGEYCREKNMTMKDLFLKCSDEERTHAWPLIVSKLSMELVAKIDFIMQEIQKDRGKQKSNATAATRTTTSATTTTGTTTTSAMTAPATPTNTNTINGMALASPTLATVEDDMRPAVAIGEFVKVVANTDNNHHAQKLIKALEKKCCR
jgi:hypothetical protein